MELETIVNNLTKIKKNLPNYQRFPLVKQVMTQKAEALEAEFLEKLQILQQENRYGNEFHKYKNWYKNYKNIEEL